MDFLVSIINISYISHSKLKSSRVQAAGSSRTEELTLKNDFCFSRTKLDSFGDTWSKSSEANVGAFIFMDLHYLQLYSRSKSNLFKGDLKKLAKSALESSTKKIRSRTKNM